MTPLNIDTLSVILNEAGIKDEQLQAHTDSGGFCGVSVEDLTPGEFSTVVGIVVAMDPYAVDALAVEKPGVVHHGDRSITLHYGDTGG